MRSVRRLAVHPLVTLLLSAGALSAGALTGCAGTRGASPSSAAAGTRSVTAIALWQSGASAFGMFVPSERAPAPGSNRLPPVYTAEGAQALAENPLLDYLFLNLEAAYDADAVRALVAGIARSSATRRPTLLVRIPTIEAAGEADTRARVKEVLALGADGVVIPHVRTVAEARTAAAFFTEAGANVWSPANPRGTVVAMLMVEDAGAIEVAADIAALPGYSLLSCGIGSLTRDMGGNAAGAEAACQRVRDLGAKAGMPSMMTATAGSITDRIAKGYRGLLLSGTAEQASAIIRTGRAATAPR
jgi:2-keto-3-deoxy-L-rhamnonate aldolase RhmA